MKQNDFPEFVGALTELAELFRCDLSETQIRLYCKTLQDLPIERLVFAINEAAKFNRFFPLPVDLRDMAQRSIPAPLCRHDRGRVPIAFDEDGNKVWACAHCDARIEA